MLSFFHERTCDVRSVVLVRTRMRGGKPLGLGVVRGVLPRVFLRFRIGIDFAAAIVSEVVLASSGSLVCRRCAMKALPHGMETEHRLFDMFLQSSLRLHVVAPIEVIMLRAQKVAMVPTASAVFVS